MREQYGNADKQITCESIKKLMNGQFKKASRERELMQ